MGGTGLYLRAVVDGLTIPGQWPDVRTELDVEPDTAALHRRLAELDPVAADRMLATNRRRVLRALEVTVGSGRPFSSFGAGLGSYPSTGSGCWACASRPKSWPAGSPSATGPSWRPGSSTRCAGCRRIPAGLSRTARQALGYRELLAHVAGELTSTMPSTSPCAAPAGSPAVSGPGSGGIPGSSGSTPMPTPTSCVPPRRNPRWGLTSPMED